MKKGFGIIPKLVMQDKRLTATAKTIYSYFCSFAGAGKTAFPSRERVMSDLDLSKNNYYKHFNLLKDYGYITVEQEHKNGRYTRNIYTLVESVQCTNFRDTVQKNTLQCLKKQDTVKQCTKICDTNNNSIKNKQSFKNISQSSPSEKEDGQNRTDRNTIQKYIDVFKNNISYEDFETAHASDLSLVDELIFIMADVMITAESYIRIHGENKPRQAVKSVLMRLTYEDIEHVIWQFKGVTERIKKKRQYLLTMLYNAPMEKYSQVTNEFERNKWNEGDC